MTTASDLLTMQARLQMNSYLRRLAVKLTEDEEELIKFETKVENSIIIEILYYYYYYF